MECLSNLHRPPRAWVVCGSKGVSYQKTFCRTKLAQCLHISTQNRAKLNYTKNAVRRGAKLSGNACIRAAFSSAGINDSTSDKFSLKDSSSLIQRVRALLFYFTTLVLALPLFIAMLFQHPIVLLVDKHRRKSQHLMNKIWAFWSTFLFYKVELVGEENLPHSDEAAVYVANHQSFLDIYALFQLGRPFKFISKTTNFFLPLVGWSMFLTGHIPLRRHDKKSQMDCLKRCIELLKKGVSVFFFPEGTRSIDGKMGEFKKGAFSIAAKAKVPVVPITLIGTDKLMPNGKEYLLRCGEVKVIIHPAIRGENADELCIQTRNTIAESLVKYST